MSACEWNPDEERPVKADDPVHGDAVLAVGANGQWHLCAECARLPRFKRYRRRYRLSNPKLWGSEEQA